MYARAFLEGRLTEAQLDAFRQEKSGPDGGLSSYPHPRLMPNLWEFPTVSMGLGPASAIYQAWFNKYLQMRGIKDTSQQRVWAFLGDGEMDEPESRGMLQLAAQQGLDNLTFVINANLQRLDGPVRGNGKIIQELEAYFRGAGWNVIKVIWGRGWDVLLNADKDRALVNLMNETLDGDYQTFKANDGAYVREHFFGRDPRTKALVDKMTDDEIWALKRGGHDYRKVYAAYASAVEHTGQPTVVIAHTIKGYGLGTSFAGRNATHQMKKLKQDDLKQLRDFLHLPISDEQLEDPYNAPYYHPGMDSPEIEYMMARRKVLGGFVPERRTAFEPIKLPAETAYECLAKGSGQQNVATTMAFVRLLKDLMKDKDFGHRIVPIIPDEARTFGLDAIFPTAKIFNTLGQNYVSVDADLMLSYKESQQGQILHTGINEAGSAAVFQSVGTSYATHGQAMVPFYIFYSMFGFQRTGDQFWAAGRPDDPRVHRRRDGRAHHADRRGPAARGRALPAPRADEPCGGPLRPGLRVRDPPHRARRPEPDVRRHRPARPERHVLPHGVQRADAAAGRAGGRGRRGHPAGPAPHPPGRRRRRAQGPAHGVRRRRAVGPGGGRAARGGLGRAGRRVVGDVLERAAP